MQRRSRSYTSSGLAAKPSGRQRATRAIRRAIAVMLAMFCLGALVYGATRLFAGSGKPVRLNALPTDTMRPFGDSLLYYDGAALVCAGPNGATRWSFHLGANADFACTDQHIVAWSGSQIYILNRNGQSTYNDRMTAAVRFARIGETYAAVCLGEDKASQIRVIDHNGNLRETLSADNLLVTDTGFFSSRGQLLWVLSLDIDGNAPITNFSTYEPGRMTTGAVELNDSLVYRVYELGSNLMLSDTDTIRAYNYKCVRQTDVASILVYGWHLAQEKTIGRNVYALLTPQSESSANNAFSELRLVTNLATQSLRMLSPCFAGGLGDKGVYGFSQNAVYFVPYGQTAARATYLTYTLTDFVCMLDGGRAVLISGNDVFLLKLPE